MYSNSRLIDPVVICPYNKNHLIAKSRLQKHIVKCEKQYPEHYKIMCPYNATHRLFKSELEEHIMTCSARKVLESEMYSELKKHGYTQFPMPSEISSTVDCTENWDLDRDNVTDDENSLSNNITPSQVININISEQKVLRAPRGFSEAMLREPDEESAVEDFESVTSSMGIGRGKIIREKHWMKFVGLGRGSPLNTD
ncbi:uncharacterized protein LOC116434701 [Nomia melanderi]|uniref:uncharacterized protein LOC116434701 n=1 Tax=Nomia melanderi TaxID=2448451 RepID=UPI0013041606|nr:protein D7-like [Nomia melanderi]